MYPMKWITQKAKWSFLILLTLFIGCDAEIPPKKALSQELAPQYQLVQEGRTGAARVQIRRWIDSNTPQSDAYFLMGLSYHNEKKYGKAVEWFSKSADCVNVYVPTWHFLGWAEFYLGNISASKKAFEQFLFFHPNEPDSQFGLGLIALEEGNLDQAKHSFQSAIDSPESSIPIQAKSHARLGDVYMQRGNLNRAYRLYQTSVEENPDLYEAWYRLAQTCNRLGLEEEAKEALQQFELARNRVRPDLQPTRFPE